ncbi:MAG: aminopeptidase P family protein [Anaerolineae bacterium]|nr:aminopeptidase P family protein [Anaerolineae bacterium]
MSNTNQELARARAELKTIRADYALLSSGDNITYVSHWEVPVEFGAPTTLGYAQPLALFGTGDANSSLIVTSFYEGGAKQQATVDEVAVWDSNVIGNAPIVPKDNFLQALRAALKKAGITGSTKAKLAIEEKTLPTVVLRLLMSEYPNVELIDAAPALFAARAIKTARELDLLRFAAEVNKAGHEELTRQCQEAGKNDFAMWAAVVSAMEQKAGHMLFVSGELVTGINCRVVAVPGGPRNYITQPGDLALMDMSPRVNGYWSDTTNTQVIGGVEPTAKQKLYGTAAREAFYAAADVLRPGHKACEGFEAARATFAKHGLTIGHYAGHQIGASVNEPPRLVAFDETPVQEGMVFSIECGAYEGPTGEVGARMEKSIIVGASGNEILCDFKWGF